MSRKLLSNFENFPSCARNLRYRSRDDLLPTVKLRSLFVRPKVGSASCYSYGTVKHLPSCSYFAGLISRKLNCKIDQGWSRIKQNKVDPIQRRGISIISTANSERICWNCNKTIGTEKFFCKTCKIIQPPLEEMTFFEIFESKVQFDIDLKSLTDNYRKLQSLLHPDKFGNSRDEEQEYSAVQSALINKAYNTLLDPLARAVYMLELRNIWIGEKNTVQDPEFLMEIMELNEMLTDVTSLKDLDIIQEKNNASIDECVLKISESFSQGDLENAKESVIKLRYYRNILETVQKKTLELE